MPTNKLEPEHLMGSDDPVEPEMETLTEKSLGERVAAATKLPYDEPKKFDPNDPKLQERYTFDFEHTDGRGKVWEGTFTSEIPSVAQRAEMHAMQARLVGGMPLESVSPEGLNVAFVLSRLSTFLKKGDDATGKSFRPDWANNLFGVKDFEVLRALWNKEVAAHEATFFGGDDPA